MSGIIGSLTAGRIAFALGTVGVGALVGGAIADHKDGDVIKGALIGGASALAGLAILSGGIYAFNRFSAARAGAAEGVSRLGTTLSNAVPTHTAPPIANVGTISNATSHASPTLANAVSHSLTPGTTTIAASATAATEALTHSAPALPAATGWRAWVSSLFHEASTAATLRPLPATVPVIARTPVLPVATATATSGSTFLSTMSRFLPVV
jgi:hypothetical protein